MSTLCVLPHVNGGSIGGKTELMQSFIFLAALQHDMLLLWVTANERTVFDTLGAWCRH